MAKARLQVLNVTLVNMMFLLPMVEKSRALPGHSFRPLHPTWRQSVCLMLSPTLFRLGVDTVL